MSLMEYSNSPNTRSESDKVSVAAGTLLLGSTIEQILEVFRSARGLVGLSWFDRELPQHAVHVDTFAIDRFPVTCRQYAYFCDQTDHLPPWYWRGKRPPAELADHPVVCVSYKDAQAYCHWAGGRLPYEAEWEKAARGGDARRYPWGEDFDPSRGNMNRPAGARMTEPVGCYPTGATPYGVMDMAGNVMEWTCDRLVPYAGYEKHSWPEWTNSLNRDFDPVDYAGRPALGVSTFAAGDTAPTSSHTAFQPEQYVVRGGSYLSLPEFCRCTSRVGVLPSSKLPELGFRCVYAPDPNAVAEQLLKEDKPEEALAMFDKALGLSPHSPVILANAARTCQRLGEEARARALWQTLAELCPEHREANTQLELLATSGPQLQIPAGICLANSEMPATLVFGPRCQETLNVLGKELEQKGIPLVAASSAEGLVSSAERFVPCTLVFSHYVPTSFQRATPREEFEKWQRRLLESVTISASQLGSVRYRWMCNPNNGDCTLVVYWPCVEALQCQLYARALEKAFLRWGGTHNPTPRGGFPRLERRDG